MKRQPIISPVRTIGILVEGLRGTVRVLAAAGLAAGLYVTPAPAQPVLAPAETEQFLASYLANDLGLAKTDVVVENGSLYIAMNLDGATGDEMVGKLGLVLLAAGAVAHWTEEVRVTGYAVTAPLFSMSVPTATITAYASGEIGSQEYVAAWQFDGIETGQPGDTDDDGDGPAGDPPLVSPDPADPLAGAVVAPCAGNAAFVRALYRAALGREAAEREVINQARRLREGTTRAQMVRNVFMSPEYENKAKTGEQIYKDLFRVLLGRAPKPGELAAWPRLRKPAMIDDFLNRAEHHIVSAACAGLWRPAVGTDTADSEPRSAAETGDPGPGLAQDSPVASSPGKAAGTAASETHTIVIDGTPTGHRRADYTISVTGTIQKADGVLDGLEVTVQPDDRISGNRARGYVTDGRDGFAVTGEIRAIDLVNPDSAHVYVDGKLVDAITQEQHTVVLDGTPTGDMETSYRIEVDGVIRQIEGRLEGFDVTIQSDDGVHGQAATGTVSTGIDGFRVDGKIRSIELSNPKAAEVFVDGALHRPAARPSDTDASGSNQEPAASVGQTSGQVSGVDRGDGTDSDAMRGGSLPPEPQTKAEMYLAQGKALLSRAYGADDPAVGDTLFARAMDLFEQSQELGSAEATYQIGFMYEIGNSVPQDNDIALSYYDAAARGGYAESYTQAILVQNQLRRHDAAAMTFFDYYKAFPEAAMQGFADRAYSPQVIRAIQTELKRTGHYRGTIDGIFGAGTRAAIPRYVASELPDEMVHSDARAGTKAPAPPPQPGAYHTPPRGTAERTAIMDAAREPISADIGQTVIFVVDRVKTDGNWAYLEAVPHRPDGGPLDWSKTPFAQAKRADMMTDTVMVLMHNDGSGWQVLDHVIGPTDVYWVNWTERYGLPEAMFFSE